MRGQKKINPVVQLGFGKCPVCHGNSWELFEDTTDLYGAGTKVIFAKRCKNCATIRRAQDETGTPKEYYDAQYIQFDFSAYRVDMNKIHKICDDLIKNFSAWEASGKGVYLWSRTPGSGKTFLSYCIAKTLMMKYDLQMRFVTEPDYLACVRESFGQERGAEDQSRIYRECRLLVLDDLGTQKDGEWMQQEMFRLINHRQENQLMTIYTSNIEPEKLKLNSRTINRIMKSAIVLQMPEQSIREEKARTEQEQFLNKILK